MPVHCTQELVNACKIEVNDVDCGNTGSFQLDRKVQTFVGFFSCIIDVIDLGLMNYPIDLLLTIIGLKCCFHRFKSIIMSSYERVTNPPS